MSAGGGGRRKSERTEEEERGETPIKNTLARTECELPVKMICRKLKINQKDIKTCRKKKSVDLSNSVFNTSCNDGEECNLTSITPEHRPLFVLQMRTSCSDHSSLQNI